MIQYISVVSLGQNGVKSWLNLNRGAKKERGLNSRLHNIDLETQIWNRLIDMTREDSKALHMTLQYGTCMAQDRKAWRATTDEQWTHAVA